MAKEYVYIMHSVFEADLWLIRLRQIYSLSKLDIQKC